MAHDADAPTARVSASQIATYQSCPRKWAFSRVHRPAQKASAALGEEVHTHLEAWLLRRTPPPPTIAGRVARNGLHLLPVIDSTYQVEHSFDAVYAGTRYTGRIDVLRLTPNVVEVIDHKTTKSIAKYAKTELELRFDPQVILYSYHALQLSSTAESVRCQWVYYPTELPAHVSPPPAQVRQVLVGRQEAVASFDDLHQKYTLPLLTDRSRPPQDVEPSPGDACQEFGGCPHKARCDAYKDPDMDLLQQLQQLANVPQATPVPVTQPTIADVVSTEAAQVVPRLPPKKKKAPVASEPEPPVGLLGTTFAPPAGFAGPPPTEVVEAAEAEEGATPKSQYFDTHPSFLGRGRRDIDHDADDRVSVILACVSANRTAQDAADFIALLLRRS